MDMCQPPRERSSTPKTKAPPLACDCHSHILGPADRFPYVGERSFTPPDAGVEDYLALLATLGFERGIVVQASVYGSDNRRTVAAVEAMGQHRTRGVVMVDAGVTAAEIRRLHDAGMRATRFITTARGGPSIDELPAVAAKVAEFGWPVEMYVPPAHWERLLPVVRALPATIVFDHMGGLAAGTPLDDAIAQAIIDLCGRGHAWVKLCGYRNSAAGYPYADVAGLAKMFIEAVPERCVWGTDWPHTNIVGHMPDDGELFDLFATWAPEEPLREQILVHNPARLYGFD